MRKKPAPKRWKRKRGKPVQIYFSDEELAQLDSKCAAQGCSRSDWFRSKLKPPKPKPALTLEPEDPRQVTVTQHLEAKTA